MGLGFSIAFGRTPWLCWRRRCHNHRVPGMVGVLRKAGLQRPSIGMNVADLASVFCYSPENFSNEMQTDFF